MSELTPPPSIVNRFPLDAARRNAMLPGNWVAWFSEVYTRLRGPNWNVLVAELATQGRAGAGAAPASAANINGGPYQGDIYTAGDSLNVALVLGHHIKPGAMMYPFVGWTTDGTEAGTVTWKVHHQKAQGHNQAIFPTSSTITFAAASTAGTAWQHMTTLCADVDALTATEADTALLMGVEMDATTLITDNIYGIFAGVYYQTDRFGTPNKAPDFYQY